METMKFSKHSIVATPAGGLQVSVSIREHMVATDQPERAGGQDTAPTPLELLGASLAGCVALYVHKHCAAQGLSSEGVVVEAKPFWRENPGRVGRYDVVVHLPATIPEAYHAGIEAAAGDCPVHHTLTHMPEVGVRLQPRGAPALASAG